MPFLPPNQQRQSTEGTLRTRKEENKKKRRDAFIEPLSLCARADRAIDFRQTSGFVLRNSIVG